MRYSTRPFLAIVTVVLLSSCANLNATEPTAVESSINPRDVTAWTPSFVPSSEPVTSIDESQSRLDLVAQILRQHDLPLPTSEDELPDVVRVVSSYDSAVFWAQCLTERGFESEATGGAVTTAEVVPEQKDIYWQTYADCVAQYPVDAKYLQTWGPDQWRVQYEYLVNYYIPCLESYGITIDPETIPIEQVYVESGLSQGDVWHPVRDWTTDPEYAELANTDTSEGAEVASTCRQTAPDEKLFGSSD